MITCFAECQEVGEKCRKESTAAWEHLEISKEILKLQIKDAPLIYAEIILLTGTNALSDDGDKKVLFCLHFYWKDTEEKMAGT